MSLTDYISRNPHGAAGPISMYDKDFVIAQIDAIVKTTNVIRQRGRPRKFPTLESHNNSKTSNTTTVIKRPRGRPRKLPLQSKCLEHNVVRQKQHNYSLHRQKVNPNLENHVTGNDVFKQRVTQQAIAKSHLPINTNTNQFLTQKQISLEMQAEQDSTQNTPQKNPGKSPLSFITYLSPSKEDKTTSDTMLDKTIRYVFSSTLIAAMTKRDIVLREIQDFIIQNNERRYKAVSKQIHAH